MNLRAIPPGALAPRRVTQASLEEARGGGGGGRLKGLPGPPEKGWALG